MLRSAVGLINDGVFFLPLRCLLFFKIIDLFFGALILLHTTYTYRVALNIHRILWHVAYILFTSFLQSYRAKSKNLFSPSISTSDDLQCPSTTSTTSTAGPNNSNMLSQSLSVGGLQSNTPSLAAIHSNSCGSPNNFNNLSARDISGLGGNSTENSLKVTKSSKPVNRWSGLWGSSSKVKLTNTYYLKLADCI